MNNDASTINTCRAWRLGWSVVAALGLLGTGGMAEAATRAQPNILLLVADDMGSADIGPYGGEISTPNLNALARNGLTFTNFHTNASCSPTRSMLMSGVDNHRNGFGTMAAQLKAPVSAPQVGKPGYEGYLNTRVVTIASLLKDNGYHTYHTGKWHLGDEDGFRPPQRGFEESYSLLGGGYLHFQLDAMTDLKPGPGANEDVIFKFRENDVPLAKWPADFYSSKNYTDKMLEYIDKHKGDGKPFFGYLAYTAPHSPLQAPQDYIKKYQGKFDAGWDQLRTDRFQRQQDIGLISYLYPQPDIRSAGTAPAWVDNPAAQQKIDARKMEVYAAMVDYLDMSIGRVIQHLKDIGEYENTIIVFMSDNGPEANNLSAQITPSLVAAGIPIDNSLANLGNVTSYVSPAPGFALSSNMPSLGSKSYVQEGGTRNNLIVSYPGVIPGQRRTAALTTVLDIVPTLLSYASATYPSTYNGKPIFPLDGRNMRALLQGKDDYFFGSSKRVHAQTEAIGIELFGSVNKAMYQGDWKILCEGDAPYGSGKSQQWQIFNLKSDPAETNDLSQFYRGRLQKMVQLYGQYAAGVGYVNALDGVVNCATASTPAVGGAVPATAAAAAVGPDGLPVLDNTPPKSIEDILERKPTMGELLSDDF